jgi:SPP1 family holin
VKKDILTLVGGFLSALLFFFGTVGITFSWFTENSINAFIWVLSAFVTLVVNVYAVYKNTYVITKKARMQKEELKKKGLK